MKIQNLNMKENTTIIDEKKSPFSVFDYDSEYVRRHTVDRPTSILIVDLDREICRALSVHLVVTSELLFRLFTNKGYSYTKHEIQWHLKKLSASGFVQKLSFESATGYFSGKGYIIAGRGVSLLASEGIRYRLGGYLSELDVFGYKRILAANQLLIAGKYDNIKVANVAFVEAKNENQKASIIVRPTAMILDDNDEVVRSFVEVARRTPTANDDLMDKLERVIKLYKHRKSNTNIKIGDELSVIIVAEDKTHAAELADLTSRLGKKIHLYFTYDRATYESNDDFLYEHPKKDHKGFFTIFAACL